ncbi:hypothetical protein SARC_14962 [Sphaeroforma arctica JP610]|uniref:Uncharacterized protein n=1 Tax=Sphaeroforma arctica JP610 TaxID=667725 RepID=A0A0L0F6Y7_9EUKA|nr:hypothetical protein SARC_14962 [Sphaeroforma arctica JP610]KNC72480.1 hypothetical protein SARC_14962 [Sphaeroforma arctica JP610]|eukprot:XP_014146382.1 hypothetical protein SARC_14962 [Sphaeroforma arctica JP610]
MGTTKEEAEAHAGEQAELSLSAVKEGAKKQLGGEVQQVKEEVEEETEPQPPAPVPAGKVPTSRNPMKKMKDKMAKTNSPMSTKSDKSGKGGQNRWKYVSM